MIAVRPSNRITLVAVAMLSLPGSTAAAQCPDGSPPPCQTQIVASATTRRVNPPLDDRTWIVVPFDNLAKSADADWLRVASVNLLYLGMSRWTDVRVIDDERVADFMRDVPEARSSPNTLSLNAGLAVAKRAGAGKLVMGDVLKLGNRTAVTAKVFDVKTGQRLRSVREETAIQDSVMPMFGKLAQRVLNIPPPPGANVGVVGTTSIAAYQEYVQGMQALNLFDMPRARQHLEKALLLDSAFALAHAKLSVLGGWISPNDPNNRVHAEAAARLSASLPPRERALINANVAFARRDYVKACEGFSGILRADSTDTDAWYGLGDCLFHDTAVEAINGDTTRLRWRGDLSNAVRAFRRALDLDPTYHLAYSHIVDVYNGQFRTSQFCVEGRCRQVIAVVRIAGDSLVTTPLLLPRDTALFRSQMEEYRRTHARRATLDRGNRVAEQWVAANPTEDRARLMHASVLLLLGKPADADSTLRRAQLKDTSNSAAAATFARLEIALKLWRGVDAVRLYDSVRSHAIVFAGPLTTGNFVTLVAPILGRMKQYDSLIVGSIPPSSTGAASRVRLARESLRLMVGAPTDSVAVVEHAVFDEIAVTGGASLASRSIAYSLTLGLRIPRPSWPALDTMSADPKVRMAVAFRRGDMAALRSATARFDSLSSVYTAALVPDTGATLIAAEGYLALGDSLRALRMTRRWLDSSLVFTPLLLGSGNTQVQPLVPRAVLMRADLASALGQREEARLWYGRWLALWSSADPEFQLLVERVRKSYAALGGT